MLIEETVKGIALISKVCREREFREEETTISGLLVFPVLNTIS
jgi:hypothetical protein